MGESESHEGNPQRKKERTTERLSQKRRRSHEATGVELQLTSCRRRTVIDNQPQMDSSRNGFADDSRRSRRAAGEQETQLAAGKSHMLRTMKHKCGFARAVPQEPWMGTPQTECCRQSQKESQKRNRRARGVESGLEAYSLGHCRWRTALRSEGIGIE